MNRLSGALLAVALLLAGQVAGAGAATELHDHRAGLVIDYGDGRVTYAVVPFAEESISGIDLLRRSGLSLVTLDFGGLGQGVCTIEDQGCGVGDCRRLCQTSRADSPFWRYFRLADDGQWSPMIRGASSAEVIPGTIDGWSWTGGEPKLPVVDLASIERMAGQVEEPADTPQAVSSTYDASGNLVIVEGAERSSWLTYGGAVALLLVLALFAGFLALSRTRSSGQSP